MNNPQGHEPIDGAAFKQSVITPLDGFSNCAAKDADAVLTPSTSWQAQSAVHDAALSRQKPANDPLFQAEAGVAGANSNLVGALEGSSARVPAAREPEPPTATSQMVAGEADEPSLRLPEGASAPDPTRQATDNDGEQLLKLLLDPPAEFPVRAAAIEGLHVALAELCQIVPEVQTILGRLPEKPGLGPVSSAQQLKSEALAAFSRRKGYHQHYLSLVHAGLTARQKDPAKWSLLAPVYQVLAVSAVRRALDAWRPTKHAGAKVTSALARPDLKANRAWTLEQRQRAASDAVHELRIAIAKHPAAAAALGLTSGGVIDTPSAGGVDEFNERFRRRMNDVQEFKTVDMQAGAGGNGALSRGGLKSAGRELLTAIRAGRIEELHVAVEVVSRLPSELIPKLPVQLGDAPPPNALAWLDVPAGAYFYTLFKLVERGARPETDTLSLYEVARQIVRVDLSPPIANALRKAGAVIQKGYCTCEELLGRVSHKPRDAVAGSGRYRATASKIQTSIPAYLLQEGEHRWLTCLATGSPFLISRGRPAYGVVRQSEIDSVVDQSCSLLGWPLPAHPIEGDVLVGGFVTPKSLAARLAFAALADEADALSLESTSIDDVVAYVNAHAAYVALLLCLVLALRNRVVYLLPTPGLRAGIALKFCDKDVHEFSMPAVPLARIASLVLKNWEDLLHAAVERLRRMATEDAITLANLMQARLADHESNGWVFTITAAHTLEPIGVRTWRDRLPRGLRLVENFGRQFWPFQLMSRGVRQTDLDILMRHQMPALHPGSSHICEPELETQRRLTSALDFVLDEFLQLPVPMALSAQAQGAS